MKQMRELLNQLAMKNGRMKPDGKRKTKLMTANRKDTEALIAKLALDATKDHIHKKRDPSVGVNESENVKFENDVVNITSAEEMENILQKLKSMGAKGNRILELLKKQFALNQQADEPQSTTAMPTTSTSDSTSTPSPLNVVFPETESVAENLLRQKREFVLKTALKHKELNAEEEETENLAIEEVNRTIRTHESHHFNLIYFPFQGIQS